MEQKAIFISKIRKSIVLTIGANDMGRISLASKSYRWPLAPNSYCCQGFIVAPGVIAGYLTEPCDCFENSFVRNKPIALAVFDDYGGYEIKYGSAYFDRREINVPVTKSGTNAYFFAANKDDTERRVPTIRKSALRSGEPVYSLGINRGLWVVTSGKFERMEGQDIVTNCNVYHGLCGAPLFDGIGHLVGWGASVEFQPFTDISRRKYDIGRFLHISELLNHLNVLHPHLEPANIDYS